MGFGPTAHGCLSKCSAWRTCPLSPFDRLEQKSSVMKRFQGIGEVFRHRNYRLYFLGMSVSLMGSLFSSIALSWLVYRLTNSGFMLGLVTFVGQFMTLVLTPFSGVILDRIDRKRVLILTQIVGMVISLILAALCLTETITLWEIFALSLLRGSVFAFDGPTRQTLVVDLVNNREAVPKAIALNSAMFNAARLIGPALGGVVIAEWGEGICMLVDGLSFVPSIFCALALRIAPRPVGEKPPIFSSLSEGLRYAFENRPIRIILMLLVAGTLVGSSYMVLLPIFAKEVFHGGPKLLGMLMGASGLGALAGSLILAWRSGYDGLGMLIPRAVLCFGAAIVCLGLSPNSWIAMLCLFISGVGLILYSSAGNTLLQAVVDDDKRGRVMSLFTLAFVGMMPLGSLLGGALAGWLGAPVSTVLAGLVCVLIAVGFYPSFRPIDGIAVLKTEP
ncbi:MAG: MFS transporter [Acidobacteriota bacterium]